METTKVKIIAIVFLTMLLAIIIFGVTAQIVLNTQYHKMVQDARQTCYEHGYPEVKWGDGINPTNFCYRRVAGTDEMIPVDELR